jgi:excisionase family DNA binding protein
VCAQISFLAVLPAKLMSDEPGSELLRQLARALPAALDDDGLQELAAKLHPYLAGRSADRHDARQLMTVAEVADQANVHVETVRRAIRVGELAVAARIGRSPRLASVAVESWLAQTSRRQRSRRPVRARGSRRSSRADLEYSLSAAFDATT